MAYIVSHIILRNLTAGSRGLYNPSGSDDGSNGRAHAVEEMTWSRNTRNYLRALVLELGLGLDSLRSLERSQAGNFTRANHGRKEAIWPLLNTPDVLIENL